MTAPARCRSCKAPILWARTVAGAAMPLDQIAANLAMANVMLNDEGRAVVVTPGKGTHVPHWATCPTAPTHRRARAT